MVYIFLATALLSTLFLYSIAVSLGIVAEYLSDKEE